MIYEIDKYTDFLCKHKITPNQFYVLWLLYTKDEKNQERWVNEDGFKYDELIDLLDKGLLIKFNTGTKDFTNADLFVSEIFAESCLVEPDIAWSNLFDAYPPYLLIEGKKVPARTLTYSDSLGVEKTYTEYIKRNKFLHARVIAATNIMKKANNGYATIKIDKFVMGKHWEDIERTDESSVSRNY